MSTKTAIRTKIAAADKATTKVIEHWRAAYGQLEGGVDYNGFGILWDVSMTYGRLHDAKKQIEQAMAVINATDWPTSRELDYLENA